MFKCEKCHFDTYCEYTMAHHSLKHVLDDIRKEVKDSDPTE